MRIIVTGWRDWPWPGVVATLLEEERMQCVGIFELSHGGCPTGADQASQDWADLLNAQNRGLAVLVRRYEADFRRYGVSAGPRRNARMVNDGADKCLALHGPCTSMRCKRPELHMSHGTVDCADKAEAAGIFTKRLYHPSLKLLLRKAVAS